MITTTCNFCEAKNVSESVNEMLAWDKEHTKHCPQRQEVRNAAEPFTEKFNQDLSRLQDGNA